VNDSATATSTSGTPALRREIGALGVAALTANIVLGSGLFVIPGLMTVLGAWAPVAIVGCAVVIAATTLCFAEASSRVPSTGGAYAFVGVGLGPLAGTIAGGLVLVSGILAAAGILGAAVDQAARLMPWLGTSTGRSLTVVGACTLFAINAMRGARESTLAIEVVLALKLAPLVLFVAMASFLPAAPSAPPPVLTVATIAPLLILGVFLFAGMESAIVVSGEVVVVLAIAIQVVESRAFGPALAQSKAPLVDVAAASSPWLATLMAGAASFSMVGCAAGLAIALPRSIYAFALDGLMPGALARLHPERRTPVNAILLHTVLVAGLTLTNGYVPLVVAAAMASMGVYILGCIAALMLRKRGVAQAGPVVAWSATPVAAFLSIVAMSGIIIGAKRAEIAAFALSIVVFSVLHLLRRRTIA
jgi:basic amino acid/polyamine antiporter, APA family